MQFRTRKSKLLALAGPARASFSLLRAPQEQAFRPRPAPALSEPIGPLWRAPQKQALGNLSWHHFDGISSHVGGLGGGRSNGSSLRPPSGQCQCHIRAHHFWAAWLGTILGNLVAVFGQGNGMGSMKYPTETSFSFALCKCIKSRKGDIKGS